MCHWDCHKAKISLRFVSLFSTCSPQEMRFLWAPHGLRRGIGSIFEPFIGRGNRSIFEPFSQFWPGRDKQQTAGEAEAPLSYNGRMRLSVYVLLVSGESSRHPKMQKLQTNACASSGSRISQWWGTYVISWLLLIPAAGTAAQWELLYRGLGSADSVVNRVYPQLVLKLCLCY